MSGRTLRRTALVLAAMLLLGPLSALSLADRGGAPRSGNGKGKAGGNPHSDPLLLETSSSDEATTQNGPDHSDESNCDGDPSGRSDSGHGANSDGENDPYDNTCPDGPSENGNGGGNAIGKPCAGCVGNADDKNPPGQYPNGDEDGNNGYECDKNNGIGKTNPAHTGCEPASNSPPPQVFSVQISKVCDPPGDALGSITLVVEGANSGSSVVVFIDGSALGGAGTYALGAGVHQYQVRVDGESVSSGSVTISDCPPETEENPPPTDENPPPTGGNPPPTEVLGGGGSRGPGTQVLGVKMIAGESLPRTGMDLFEMAFMGLVLTAIGLLSGSIQRKQSAVAA